MCVCVCSDEHTIICTAPYIYIILSACNLIDHDGGDGGCGIGGSLSYVCVFFYLQKLYGMHNDRAQKIGFNLTRLYLSFAHGLYNVEQMAFCICRNKKNTHSPLIDERVKGREEENRKKMITEIVKTTSLNTY